MKRRRVPKPGAPEPEAFPDVADAEASEASEGSEASEEEAPEEKGFLGTLHQSSATFGVTVADNEEREDLQLWSDGGSDDSDDEPEKNRIGNVPLKWYEGEDHVGYDLEGAKVLKTLKSSEIDALLNAADNPDAWRTVRDVKNDREVVLSRTDLELIRRIRSGQYPGTSVDPHEMVEFTNKDSLHPVSNWMPPKSRFVPSKWEGMKVAKLVNLLRAGRIRPPKDPPPEVFDLWSSDAPGRRKAPTPIPPPKMPLPGHAESYNPPSEYLMTEEEKKEWEEMADNDKPISFIPQKFSCLRHVPLYENGIVERYNRCLDLYLCPRALKMRMNVDPKSLLPNLPAPKDLRPFPTQIATSYDGHAGRVRALAASPCGRWVATGAPDGVRIFDVATSHQTQHLPIPDPTFLAWGPHLLVAAGDDVLLVQGEEEVEEGEWAEEDQALRAVGVRLRVKHPQPVSFVCWHHKGSFFATVCPHASATKQCTVHNVVTKKSVNPFRVKGQIQTVAFHPSKPLFFVASQRTVRVYDLQKQKVLKELRSGAKHISSISVHRNGEHLLVGSYCSRLIWFDLELSSFPFKTLRYHERGIRHVTYHPVYPLMASASDDGSVHVFHAKALDDFSNPVIVPVKRLRGHVPQEGLGVLGLAWHPTQPWLLSAGADSKVFLWS